MIILQYQYHITESLNTYCWNSSEHCDCGMMTSIDNGQRNGGFNHHGLYWAPIFWNLLFKSPNTALMKTEHGTNTNGLEKECPFLTVGISMMISSVSLSMYPSLAMNRGTMSLKSPRLRRSEQRQSGSWNCLRWLFKAVSARHKCVPSHSPWYGTIWGLHHFGWLVCLCGGLLVRGGFLAFCTLDFGPGTYIAKLWPEGFPENVRLQFLQPMDYKNNVQ